MRTIADSVADSHAHGGGFDRSEYEGLDAEPGALERNFVPSDLVAHQSAAPLPAAGWVRDLCANELAAVPGGTPLATYDSRRHALQSKES